MRSYGDGCSSAHALDLVGERWALLIVRDLLFGPKRFTDLHAGPRPGQPQRLDPAAAGARGRRRRPAPPAPAPASANVYELTEWGAELEPILMGLQRWGAAITVAAPRRARRLRRRHARPQEHLRPRRRATASASPPRCGSPPTPSASPSTTAPSTSAAVPPTTPTWSSHTDPAHPRGPGLRRAQRPGRRTSRHPQARRRPNPTRPAPQALHRPDGMKLGAGPLPRGHVTPPRQGTRPRMSSFGY